MIKEINNCCGCGICVYVCPSNCIKFEANEEGFLMPQLDKSFCTNCHLCMKVCPCIFQSAINDRIYPAKVYAAWYKDPDIRKKSSSGGFFSAISKVILDRGGIVVGAALDENLCCKHVLVENIEDLTSLRGSKYVQSFISSDIIKSINTFLCSGRKVLFTGTPCQVSGLRNLVGDKSKNLILVDFVCKGVPSPMWFSMYINSLNNKNKEIVSIFFRDKKFGWKKPRILHEWNNGKKRWKKFQDDIYMASFLKNLALRESCYKCMFKNPFRHGDLTMADFWKVFAKYPQFDLDDKGTSLLLVNTEKGGQWLENCKENLFIGEADLEHAMIGNPMLYRSALRPKSRDFFYKDMLSLSMGELRKKYQLHSRSILSRAVGAAKRKFSELNG
jgi:Pyruvate/2-oxoacid:ferredoxin oxidoreductase delta subunit